MLEKVHYHPEKNEAQKLLLKKREGFPKNHKQRESKS